MIRIATLDFAGLDKQSVKRGNNGLSWLHQEEIDVLCCHGIGAEDDDRVNLATILANELGMTSHYVAGGMEKTSRRNDNRMDGIALLCSRRCWMIRSGSLCVPGETKSTAPMGQFAVIRQRSDLVVVLNLRLAETADPVLYQKQLAAIAALPILQRKFSALVLCGRSLSPLSESMGREFRKIETSLDGYQRSTDSPGKDMVDHVAIFVKRQGAVARLKSCNGRLLCGRKEEWQVGGGVYPEGMRLDLDITGIPEKIRTRRYRHTSFSSLSSRNWQGGRASCSI